MVCFLVPPLLTIQNTKKETIFVSLRRVAAFVIAICISATMFWIFDYTTVAFGCFIFLFVAVCSLFHLKEGISMNAVLTTHFLIEKRMDFPMIMNETAILFIGMGIGIVVNLIMPRNKERIRKEQIEFENMIRQTLRGMAETLKHKDACLIQNSEAYADRMKEVETNEIIPVVDFKQLDEHLEDLIKKAYENAGNTLLTDTRYLIMYFEMRKRQIQVLKNIMVNIERIPVILVQSIPVADFMNKIAISFHEFNNVEGLLDEMEELYEFYRKVSLPETREEFEYRAILFQIFTDLRYFLEIKRSFISEIEQENMRSYWD